MLTLSFIVKTHPSYDRRQLLELFLKDWIDENCENEVQYKVSQGLPESPYNKPYYKWDLFKVQFSRDEDATAIKLKGIPDILKNYVEIIH